VINTGRGGLVEQDALIQAVREGRLAGAGLDVTDPEPPDPSDPVLHTPGIYVLPHIGSASHGGRSGMTRVAVENVMAVLSGKKPLTCINPEVLR
jgi:glyoxylate reductase